MVRQEQWKALEDSLKAGKTRAIGVSHFCERHLMDIMEIATIKPAINQVEFHIGMGSAGNRMHAALPVPYSYRWR